MKNWVLSIVLFVTTMGGLVNARADDRDQWRHRRYEHQRDRWHYREARREHWRHRHHYYRRNNGIVIQVP